MVNVSSEHKLTKDMLEKMGITLLSDTTLKNPTDKVSVSVPRKIAMRLDRFAVPSQLYERQVDVAAAQAMAVFFRDMMSNPLIAPAIGPDQALLFANEVARLAGLPLPKPLTNTGMTPQKIQQQQQDMIAGIMNEVMRMVKEGNKPILEAIKTNELLIAHIYRALGIQPPNVTKNPTQQALQRVEEIRTWLRLPSAYWFRSQIRHYAAAAQLDLAQLMREVGEKPSLSDKIDERRLDLEFYDRVLHMLDGMLLDDQWDWTIVQPTIEEDTVELRAKRYG